MRNLILITVLVVGAAAWAVADRDGETVDASASGPFLPELQGAVNDVARMTIQADGASFSVARADDGWVVADWDDYPASFETVKTLVTGLADMEIRNRMTGLRDRHVNLGLEDPAGDGASSVGLRVEAEGGRLLADLVVGKPRDGRPAGVYVRHADDDQTWLVSGSVAPPRDAAGWVDKQLVRVAADDVQSVTIAHPDGEVVHVQRPAPEVAADEESSAEDADATPQEPADIFADLSTDDAPEWELAGLPEGYTLKSTYVLSGLAGGLARLDMERLATDDDELPGDDAWTRATVVTAGGLSVELSVAASADETTWYARLAVASQADASESAREQAADLAAQLSGRTFVIPSWRATTFTKRLADLADPPPAPEPEPDVGLPLAPDFLPADTGDAPADAAAGDAAAITDEPASDAAGQLELILPPDGGVPLSDAGAANEPDGTEPADGDAANEPDGTERADGDAANEPDGTERADGDAANEPDGTEPAETEPAGGADAIQDPADPTADPADDPDDDPDDEG